MNSDIKAAVLDVDGILVGFKGGNNFPVPGEKIINALKAIKSNGIPVILCTGRSLYTPATKIIIEGANLDNFHIGDMGGLIANQFSKKVLLANELGHDDVSALVGDLFAAGMHINIYTPEYYLVGRDQYGNGITPLLTGSVEVEPRVVDDLFVEIDGRRVLYVSGISQDYGKKEILQNIVAKFSGRISLLWANNLWLENYCYGVFTPALTSKSLGLKELLNHLEIPFEKVLGVGDGTIDWDFMRLCGYRATLQNALPEVLQNVSAGDPERNFIGLHVDQDGIIEVFRNFQLL